MPRPRAWLDFLMAQTLTGTPLVVDLLAAATVNLDTITAVRIILHLEVWPASLTSTFEGVQSIDMGIGVSSVDAFGIGISAMPDPRVQADTPPRGWLWRSSISMYQSNADGAEAKTPLPGIVDADLSSMRKVDRGTLSLVIAKTARIGSAFDCSVLGLIRTLCLT